MTRPPPDLFSPDRPVRSDFARGGPPGASYALRRMVTVVVVLGLLGWGGYGLVKHFLHRTPGEIPTIKAEGPYKEKPEQPGGIDIPHQDVQLYQELDSGVKEKPKAERLLPPPEQPNPAFIAQPASAAPSPPASEELSEPPSTDKAVPPNAVLDPPKPISVTTTVGTPPKVEAKAETKPDAPVLTPATSTAVQAAAPNSAPGVEKPAVTTPVVVDESKTTSPTGKAITVVQLAALPDSKAADAMAAKLQAKFSGALGVAKLRVIRADLGAKGIFYRVQTQALPDSDAQAICKVVKQQNSGCLLVRH